MTDLTLQATGQRVLYLRNLEPELWKRVMQRASTDGLTLKEAVIAALRAYVETKS